MFRRSLVAFLFVAACGGHASSDATHPTPVVDAATTVSDEKAAELARMAESMQMGVYATMSDAGANDAGRR